jgi:hypothetical protein
MNKKPRTYTAPCDLEPFLVDVDYENSAEEFWDTLAVMHPDIRKKLTETPAMINTEEWDRLREVPGFASGPRHARFAVVIVRRAL